MIRTVLFVVLLSFLLFAKSLFAHHHGIKYGVFKIEAGKFLFQKPNAKQASLVPFGKQQHLHELSSRLETVTTSLISILPSKFQSLELKKVKNAARFVHDNQHRNNKKSMAEKLSGLNVTLKAAKNSYLKSEFYESESESSKIVLKKFETANLLLLHLMNDAGVATSEN